MVSSTHRKQYASRIFKKNVCVQTRSRRRLKNASAQFLCNSSRTRPGSSPSALRHPQHRYSGAQLSHQQVKKPSERYTVETWYPNMCPPHKQSKTAACNCYLDLGQPAFVQSMIKLHLEKNEAGVSSPAFCFRPHMCCALKSQWEPHKSVYWHNLVPNTAIKAPILQSEKSILFHVGVNQAMQL